MKALALAAIGGLLLGFGIGETAHGYAAKNVGVYVSVNHHCYGWELLGVTGPFVNVDDC